MTIKINSIAIDLVPAVRLMEWPQPARGWTSNWLGPTLSREIASEAHAVPKIHQSGERFTAHSTEVYEALVLRSKTATLKLLHWKTYFCC
jgi:hypothetical protein